MVDQPTTPQPAPLTEAEIEELRHTFDASDWDPDDITRIIVTIDQLRADLARLTADRDEAVQRHGEALCLGLEAAIKVTERAEAAEAERDAALARERALWALLGSRSDVLARLIEFADKNYSVHSQLGIWDDARAEFRKPLPTLPPFAVALAPVEAPPAEPLTETQRSALIASTIASQAAAGVHVTPEDAERWYDEVQAEQESKKAPG